MDSKKSEYEEETTNQTTKGKTIDKVRLRLSIDVNNAEIYFQRINLSSNIRWPSDKVGLL